MSKNRSKRMWTTCTLAMFAVLATATTHAGLPQLLTSKARNWDFIQSAGGMAVSVEGTTLTVDCDVSGLKTVTVKPTLINSGIGVRDLKVKRKGKTIFLTLKTCVIGKGVSTSPDPVDLSGYPDGTYEVKYRDPDGTTHSVGKIVIKKEDTKKTERAAAWRSENPNIRITLQTGQGINNINIKRGQTSFLNYEVAGAAGGRVVAINVSDETYIELRDACFAVLRKHPESVDEGKVMHINVTLSEEEVRAHGLSKNSFAFRYQPGKSQDADALYKLTAQLLETQLSLDNLVYVDPTTAATQHPLVCGKGRDFPKGHEMLFTMKGTGLTIHAVFPPGVKPPKKLNGVFTLQGDYQAIKKWDAYGTKKPPGAYTYFVVTSYERVGAEE